MVIGRGEELARIDRLLASARLGTSDALALTGEPGIGKTSLLDHAVARADGMTVLRATGIESESEIPFAGLLTLLRPALELVDTLPGPQAGALRAALGLTADTTPPDPHAAAARSTPGLTTGAAGDRFLIGAATLSLLTGLAERSAVLVVIDDAHWLDDSSMAAILFAARRLLADAVGLLIAARDGPSFGLPELRLSGVDRATAAALLERRAGRPLPPGAADRAFSATLGNPLALVELAASAAELPLEPAVPVRTSLEAGFAARVRALPGATQRMLALAAADERGDLGVIAAAATLPVHDAAASGNMAAGRDAAAGDDVAAADDSVAAGHNVAAGDKAAGSRHSADSPAPADSPPTPTSPHAADSPPTAAAVLAPLAAAERAGLVALVLDRLTFCHPLARAAAYRCAAPDERRAAHAALARVEPDADRRAWHRAAAALGPDAEAADALEQAGLRARDRGAYTAAASSLERAARLTADQRSRAARLFRAAEAAWLAGHADRAGERLADARAIAEDPSLRVAIEHLRGHAAFRSGQARAAYDILLAAAPAAPPNRAAGTFADAPDRAAERTTAAPNHATEAPTDTTDTAPNRTTQAPTDTTDTAPNRTTETSTDTTDTAPDRAAEMLAEATDAAIYAAEPARALVAARRAWATLNRQSSDRARCRAELALGMALIYTGDHAGVAHLYAATELLETSPVLANDPALLASAATGALWLREAERGRALIQRAIEAAREQGAVGALPFPLWLAGRDAATSDRPHVAIALYEEAIRLARETGQATSVCAGLAGLACVEARQGRDTGHAAEALELARALGLAFFEAWALDAVAELELGRGNLDAAISHLEAKQRLLDERGIADPDVSPVPELAEARRGERTDLDAYEHAAHAKGQPWALARLARATGDYDTALALHARTPDRFETARTLLAQGETLRRQRHRADARPPLRDAIAIFDALGAAPWAERARRELQASGETARRRDPLTLDALTPRELQVALVLAEGHTIREAAGKLFLSPKTVDHHLQSVYRKLAIDSRTALAAALGEPLPMRAPHART